MEVIDAKLLQISSVFLLSKIRITKNKNKTHSSTSLNADFRLRQNIFFSLCFTASESYYQK